MTTSPYGSWRSPLSVGDLASASVGLAAPAIDRNQLYWLESRPDQGGRTSLWRCPLAGGDPEELTPAPTYVRTRVHEYGGGEYDVKGGVVVYSELSDGRVYRLGSDGPTPITSEGPYRYADLRVHPECDLVLAVREDHSAEGEALHTLVALRLTGDPGPGVVLCAGADFYSTPELSDGGHLAWTEWDHPNMPWDATRVVVAPLASDEHGGWLVGEHQVAAGNGSESAVQPRWAGPDLLLVSDRSGWWNLYRWRPTGALTALYPLEAEFCTPQWQFGQQPYLVLGPDRVVCTLTRGGAQQLALLDLTSGSLNPIPAGVAVTGLAAGDGMVAIVAGYADRPPELVLGALAAPSWTTIRSAGANPLPAQSVSRATAVSWQGPSGLVHGWYYPPANADFDAPAETLPPLITLSHGGPTACASPAFAAAYQFWTSRGFAILDVNYGGSTGYGRGYRERLNGQWGVVDVRDCADGARAMGDQRLADPQRLAIKGNSAGGFTTLAALTGTEVFAAGISQYGIASLEALASDTASFESRYLDGLVGPYPQARSVYLERSPLTHIDRLSAPILLLQGTEDMVVPPNQAEMMAAAARAKGLPVALLMFAGEGHGFRRSDSITAALEAQLSFLGRIFGFTPADDVPAIAIDNLP